MRKLFRRIHRVILICALSIYTLAAHAVAADEKRNVLFILVDDLNTALGAYGNPIVKTPNIDQLAKRGVTFKYAYAQLPLCNPSRSSILTGRYPENIGILHNDQDSPRHVQDMEIFPEYFKQHGYYTVQLGKIWHRSFSFKPDLYARNDFRTALWTIWNRYFERSYVNFKYELKGAGSPVRWAITNREDDEELDGFIARRIVETLEENKNKLFFMAVGLKKTHHPFDISKKYYDLYPPHKIELSAETIDDRSDVPPIALKTTRRDGATMPSDLQQQAIAAYYASVSFVDTQIGLIFEALDRLKLWESTVVVLTSDHGFMLGEHGGMWAKASLFDEATRVPLIIAAPHGKADAVSDRPVELVDLYPTLTQLAGLPSPDGLDGTSLVPLLEDPHRPWTKAAFSMISHRNGITGRSVRKDRYRYTEWYDKGVQEGIELYDLQRDPREITNLAKDSNYVETMKRLKKVLEEFGAESEMEDT